MRMKIVADENIPNVQHYFGADVTLKPGRHIVREDLLAADMLLVRSVTQVNEALLAGTPVKFVGSATIGSDHLDIAWLNQANIAWALASGSNASAVMEYVACCIAALQKMNFLTEKKIRAAVIGVGDIGSRVAALLTLMGFEVILCDPFRTDLQSVSLQELSDVDLVTLHTPLTHDGLHPTYHLLDQHFFARQKKNCILLNTGRGATVDFSDLKMYGQSCIWCFDVWENEPLIDFSVLQPAVLATPHIAGYSIQSKYRGIEMLYQAALQQKRIPAVSQEVTYPTHTISFAHRSVDWRDVVLSIFDPALMTQTMKQRLMEDVDAFDVLRKEFNERHEFGFVKVSDAILTKSDLNVLTFLGLLF